MSDTIKTLRSRIDSARRSAQEACRLQVEALDDLTARVAAFEKARVEEEEPPALTEDQYKLLEDEFHGGVSKSVNRAESDAAKRLRYCERELARLREGLNVQVDDLPADRITPWTASDLQHTEGGRMAREIQRHRALVSP